VDSLELIACAVALLFAPAAGQRGGRREQVFPTAQADSATRLSKPDHQDEAESELQAGTKLTREGRFADAIPHLLAARGHVVNDYAASFNLALCYAGTRQFDKSLEILQSLRKTGHETAEVENLLAQSYIGKSQPKPAFEALQRAASMTPANEKLYLFVGDACMDRHDYALGLRVADLGLTNVPDSARLHYQRGLFLSLLDEFDQARTDFDLARKLSPASEISYLSAANEELYSGNPAKAAESAREGVGKGYDNPTLLTILGESLIRIGVRPGEPGFAEAQSSLEKAVAVRPADENAQISLGKLYLLADRLGDAVVHLEKARDLDSENPSVYASLAKAYQRHGDLLLAHEALVTLEKINKAQAERISSAPGDHKVSYAASGSGH
jgi:tetratricopeptide (TPR) repeat protein